MKYRENIDAIQFLPNEQNLTEVKDFLKDTHADYGIGISGNVEEIRVPSSHSTAIRGVVIASKNDYIIKDARGEFYSCDEATFEETYEKVVEGELPRSKQKWRDDVPNYITLSKLNGELLLFCDLRTDEWVQANNTIIGYGYGEPGKFSDVRNGKVIYGEDENGEPFIDRYNRLLASKRRKRPIF